MHFNILSCTCGSIILPQRYVLIFMLTLAVLTVQNIRNCFHIAITKITVKGVNGQCLNTFDCENQYMQGYKTNWSQTEQGTILASFFAGHFISYLAAILLIEQRNGKHILGTSVLVSAIMSGITPTVIKIFDFWGIIILRFLMGFAQGFTFPAINLLVGQWIPPEQRFRISAFLANCILPAASIGYAVTGQLISFYKNWTLVFCIWGGVGAVWYLLYLITCFSKPCTHPFITKEERLLLETANATTTVIQFKNVFKNASARSAILLQVGHDFLMYTLLINLPRFFDGALKFTVSTNGMYTSSCFGIIWASSYIFGKLADTLVNNKLLNVIHMRKIFALLPSVGSSTFLLLCTEMDGIVYTIWCIWIAMFLIGAWYPGPRLLCCDITPNFCEVLVTFNEGIGSVSGIIAPFLFGKVLEQGTFQEWKIIFITILVVCVMLVFQWFSTAQRAEWDAVIDNGKS